MSALMEQVGQVDTEGTTRAQQLTVFPDFQKPDCVQISLERSRSSFPALCFGPRIRERQCFVQSEDAVQLLQQWQFREKAPQLIFMLQICRSPLKCLLLQSEP